jgi:hypothetical protein
VLRAVVPVAAPIARPLAALTAPVRVPLAIAAAPLGRAAPVARPRVALRAAGRDLTPGALADAVAGSGVATGRLLVLVPDAGADELVWERGSEVTGSTYAARLQQLLGWTPVHTRLDAGSPVEAGLELAALLQRLSDLWPVPVERIVILAAGQGGLAVRAACAVRLAGTPWATRLSEVVGLGVPRYAAEPSRLSSELGQWLDEQVAGIVVADEAFLRLEPGAEADQLLVTEQPLLPPHRLGSALGGVLWWRHRRGGRPRYVVDLFPNARCVELPAGGPLTNRPEVHDALLRWLA